MNGNKYPYLISSSGRLCIVEYNHCFYIFPSELISTSHNMELRLIVPLQTIPSLSTRAEITSINLEGRQWRVTDPFDISDKTVIPKFTCISYLWGEGRCEHAFDSSRQMSDRTLPVLAMVIRNSPNTSAFWIDTFCVPAKQPLRSATLRSMGFIYNLAADVFVALSVSTFNVIDQWRNKPAETSLSNIERQLQVLEDDQWVSSVWTYQEIMNSKIVHFVASEPAAGPGLIDGIDLFNQLGQTFQRYKEGRGLNDFEIWSNFPAADALQQLVADWYMSSYLGVSALRVMSNLDRRSSNMPKNYFYSMLGVFTQQPSWLERDSTVAELSESLMSLCEQKNDYSFLYSSTPRDGRIGKRWRPKPDFLHAVLAWHVHGNAQKGYYTSEGFWLGSMMKLDISDEVDFASKEFIVKGLHLSTPISSPSNVIASDAFRRLEQIGFTGSNQYVVSAQGLFFPQNQLDLDRSLTVLVSASLRWTFGAPGIAKNFKEGIELFTPGVFVGIHTEGMSSPVLLDSTAGVSKL